VLGARARVRVRVTERVPEDRDDPEWPIYDEILRGGLSNGVLLHGFDAVLRVESRAHDAGTIAGVVGEHVGVVGSPTVSWSTAVFGREIAIFAPMGPVMLVYCMRRNPAIDHDEFSAAWRVHAKIAEGTPNITGYRQLHASPADSATANRVLGTPDTEIDGVVLASFSSIIDFSRAVGGPKTFTQPSLESERRFNDIDRATAVLTRVVYDSGSDA
jgi:hypothetical protein